MGVGISYVGLDISFEMLLSAAQDAPMQDVFRSLKGRGEVIGFCGDFYQLGRAVELVPEGDRKIFLLLGNTIGNEPQETDLLDSIHRSMRRRDLLLIDCQEIHDKSKYIDLAELPSTESTFDIVPFRCFGIKPEELVHASEIEEEAHGVEQRFKVRCIAARQIHHPITSTLSLDTEWYTAMTVKRYREHHVRKLLETSGFSILSDKLTEVTAQSNYFAFRYYVCARR